jgi:hypothetical protein
MVRAVRRANALNDHLEYQAATAQLAQSFQMRRSLTPRDAPGASDALIVVISNDVIREFRVYRSRVITG